MESNNDQERPEDTQYQLDQIVLLKDMFASEGWKVFMGDMNQNLTAVNHVQGVVGSQELGNRQGQVSTIYGVLNYQATIETVEKQFIEDREAEASEESDEDA